MKNEKTVSFDGLKLGEIQIEIIGKTPMIQHKFSEKSKKQIIDKQTKKGKTGRDQREIENEVIDCVHWIDKEKQRVGFPAGGIKKSIIRGVKNSGGEMITAKTAFNIIPDDIKQNLVEIFYESWEPQEDYVRLNGKTADVRYRPVFHGWSAILSIEYDTDLVSADQIVVWIEKAGFGVGIGDWRPEKDGSYGTFTIVKK